MASDTRSLDREFYRFSLSLSLGSNFKKFNVRVQIRVTMEFIKQYFKGLLRKWWGVMIVVLISIICTYEFLEEAISTNAGRMYIDEYGIAYDAIIFYGTLFFIITLLTISIISVALKYTIILVYIILKQAMKYIRKRKHQEESVNGTMEKD